MISTQSMSDAFGEPSVASKNLAGKARMTSRLCACGCDSCGRTSGCMSNGASMRPPILSDRKSREKLSRTSMRSITESASPSASRRLAECQFGVPKHTCVLVRPIILATTPTEVCGARPTTRWPTRPSASWTL